MPSRPLLLALLLVLLAAPAAAQPRSEAYLRAWGEEQARAAGDDPRIRMTEATERTIDGGFGPRRVRVLATLDARAGEGWRRRVLEATAGGREVPPERLGRIEERYDRLSGAGPLLDALLQPAPLLRSLRPLDAEPTPDAAADRPAWRIDLAPRERDRPLERLTLWFGREDGHLLRARAVLGHPAGHPDRRPGGRRGGPRGASVVVTTDYARFGGLDLPVRRTVEGTVRTRRRGRTFTVVVEAESRFTEHVVEGGAP